MSSAGREVTGQDPKNAVFKGLAAVVYASEAPQTGGYIDQSRMLAMAADMASRGLRGKRVLDVGSGFGTTALAIARHAPAKIIAVDSSEAHIDLLATIIGRDSIEEYLIAKGAPEVLGAFYEPTLRHLQTMRRDYESSVFRKAGGYIQPIVASTLDLSAYLQDHSIDVVIGNNWLHWPVNHRRAAYGMAISPDAAFTEAFDDAVRPIFKALRSGGTFAILEPADFSYDDTDEKWTALIEKQAMTGHPVYVRFQEIINDLLKKEHGINRVMPKTARLFAKSQMKSRFAASGFTLETITGFESMLLGDSVEAFYVRAPMWLGAIDLPFDKKVDILKRTKQIARETLSKEQLEHPLRGEYTIYVARRN